MRTLKLFSGTASLPKVARSLGFPAITADLDPRFEPDLVMDIMDLKAEMFASYQPEFVWASPPCECFSVASMSRHWTGGYRAYVPKTENARRAIELTKHTVELIREIDPEFWVIENPRGVMRKMDFMPNGHRQTAWYCQYGDKRAKPTDLWTNVPITFRTCRNGAQDHDEARRGAKTGTQGMSGRIDRGVVPRMLCLEILIACILAQKRCDQQ